MSSKPVRWMITPVLASLAGLAGCGTDATPTESNPSPATITTAVPAPEKLPALEPIQTSTPLSLSSETPVEEPLADLPEAPPPLGAVIDQTVERVDAHVDQALDRVGGTVDKALGRVDEATQSVDRALMKANNRAMKVGEALESLGKAIQGQPQPPK